MSLAYKILMLSNSRIFPNQTGGHLRSGNLAKALARLGHEVQIYSVAGRREDYGQGRSHISHEIEAGLTEQTNLSLGFGLCQTIARRLDLPRLWQYPLLRYGRMPKSLAAALNWADAIVCESFYHRPLPLAGRKPWLLLSHNLEYELLLQSNWIDRRLLAPIVKRMEERATSRFDGILACAADDFSYFSAHNPQHIPIQLLPNGIDSQAYAPDPSVRTTIRAELGLSATERLIVFAGSRFAPNLEALVKLRKFVAEHADFLRAKQIKFLILGSMAESMRSDGLIATGFVPSVLPYFQAADFAINPIQRGSGSNVKLFEYLAARLPVLSTEFGVRGTELIAQRDYVPFKMDTLTQTLENLDTQLDAQGWREFAQTAWTRHADRCDMTALVRSQWSQLEQRLAKARVDAEQPSSSSSQIVFHT